MMPSDRPSTDKWSGGALTIRFSLTRVLRMHSTISIAALLDRRSTGHGLTPRITNSL